MKALYILVALLRRKIVTRAFDFVRGSCGAHTKPIDG